MCGQKMTLIMQPNEKNNLPGGPEGKNYAAIVKTQETKKGIVTKSLNFMKNYGFVPGDTKVDAIDANTSEVSYDVLIPLTMFYQQMLHMDANKLYCKLRFEFHDSNVMIVFQDMHNEILGLYWNDSKKGSDAYADYQAESAALSLNKTLIGKFLVHANLDPAERKTFYEKLDNYFSDIANRSKTYEQLVKNGEAKWLTREGVIKQYTETPVPGSKYVVAFLEKPESQHVLLGISQKRWDKQVKEVFENLFRAFCLELNGDIDGIAEDGNQTWAIENGMLLPVDPKLKKTYIKQGRTFFDGLD
jgi:hypothetical protein